jgi:hypothetical protein
MSAHSLFSNIVDKFASETEIVCSDLIIALGESRETAGKLPDEKSAGTAKNEN